MKNLLLGICCLAVWGVVACNNSSTESLTSSSVPALEKEAVSPPPKQLANSAAAILAKKQVPVLCYHQIRDYTPRDSRSAKAYIVPPAAFEEQMRALADSGYQTILPEQLYQYLLYNQPLPEKPVLISFDDTRLDQFTTALPILDKYGFKGAFFIMTVSIGRPGYMSAEQVTELSRRGHLIGSHTWDHHDVRKYQGEDWSRQIDKPSAQLEKWTGLPTQYFAYPFGLWNRAALPELEKRTVKLAFQLADERDPDRPLMTVRRIIVPGSFSGKSLLKAMNASFP